MAEQSKIEWTDATWQPITGCSIASPGCKHCYAMKLAAGRLRNHSSRKGLTKPSNAGPVWTGEVRFNEQWLTQPLTWRAPRNIFVCAHGDLFHEDVPDAWIDRVFAVMALAPQHTFQVLTKRAERMRDYLTTHDGMGNSAICRAINQIPNGLGNRRGALSMPLPNVWLGVSTERQKEYDERKEHLRNTPAAVRFFSMEPLLGPIIADYLGDWVIVGGESGAGARAMHHEWAQSLRDQCAAAGVPFFFKQWGEHTSETVLGTNVDVSRLPKNQAVAWGDGKTNHTRYTRVGKKAAGRLLDGVEHSGMPEVAR